MVQDKETLRRSLMARSERMIEEIDQIFLDVEYWNNHVRAPSESPIDPDPDGYLKELRATLHQNIQRLTQGLTVKLLPTRED